MSLQPAIIEFGTGIDLHGQNVTEAARRAVWNATVSYTHLTLPTNREV